jgi:glutamate-ammonia-ligase adenylyltransferase
MELLARLSLDDGGLPRPADRRRLSLGLEAWHAALADAEPGPATAAARDWSRSLSGEQLLGSIFGNSPFLSGLAVREWQFLTRLVEAGPDPLFTEIAAAIEDPEEHDKDAPALMRRLRIAKRRTALLAAVAELAGVWSLEQQTEALSRFAEAAIGASLRYLLREAVSNKRIVLADTADPEHDSGLIVLGMGKLGARELNYSSDVDLILFFAVWGAISCASSRSAPATAMCSAPICGCARIPALPRWRCQSRQRWPIMKASARIGSAPR